MGYALITGASKGIGRAIAIELAKRKYDLILVSRSGDLLNELSETLKAAHGVKCSFITADLTCEEEVKKVADYVQSNNIQLQILVNNAGYGLWGRFDQGIIEDLTAMMKINMFTPVLLTYMLLPVLKKQRASYVLNVASTAAYQAVPTLGVYAASKSFILLFSRALRYELRETPVSVSCISPGATETNFMNAAGMHSEEMKKRAAQFNMEPSIVARIAINGMLKKKSEIIPGFINWISVAMTSWVPKKLTEKIAAGLYE